MLSKLKDLYLLLEKGQKRELKKLQILVILMAIFELVGIIAIAPFMAVVADSQKIQESGILNKLYYLSAAESVNDFLFILGVFVIVFLGVAAVVSSFTVWKLSMYGNRIGAQLGSRLFKYYLNRDWLFHVETNSSSLSSRISQESSRLTLGVINPFMQMNARILMAALISTAVFIYNPLVAMAAAGIFIFSYTIIFKIVRSRIIESGQAVTEAQEKRFKLMSEGFGGVKDTLLLGRQQMFITEFDRESECLASAQGRNQALSLLPRYIIELVAFGGVVALVLYLLRDNEGDISNVLPILSVYTLAGLKLLPAFQQIYVSISTIRGNLAAFEALKDDLIKSGSDTYALSANSDGELIGFDKLSLNNVSFRYPGKTEAAISNINIEINAGEVVGIVGPSGSGKSTLVDVLLGLIKPQDGMLMIDGKEISADILKNWRSCIGYVPQSIYLSDGTIRQNVAFGLPDECIDDDLVNRALSLSNMDGFVRSLPNGAHTMVGERGVQISGGQKQRIGIARALYKDPDVIVFDEATSALDGISEKEIMKSINKLKSRKTIIMIAHRLNTLKECGTIFFMDGGEISDQGSYDYLEKNNQKFKEMGDKLGGGSYG